MNEKLANLLEKDEELRFYTKPEEFDLLDETNKKTIVTKLAITFFLTLAIILLYIGTAAKSGGIKWGLVVFLAAIGVLIMANDFTTARKIRKIAYALTDKRLIVLEDAEKILPLSEIKKYEFRKDADGHTSLLIGDRGLKTKEKKFRALAAGPVGKTEDEKEIDRFGLYAISDAKKFEAAFKELMS